MRRALCAVQGWVLKYDLLHLEADLVVYLLCCQLSVSKYAAVDIFVTINNEYIGNSTVGVHLFWLTTLPLQRNL